jgi:hypothetical protein
MATISVIVPGRAKTQVPAAIQGRATVQIPVASATAQVPVIERGNVTVQAPVVSRGNASIQTQTFGRVEPALPLNALQFNNEGYFGGSSSLVFDDTSNFLFLSGLGASFLIHATEVSNENIFLIKNKNSNLLQVDGVNNKLTFNGTGYFNSLYLNGKEVPTKAFVTGVSGYLDDKTNFLFSSASIPSGASSHFIEFGRTLHYIPRVITQLVSPLNENTTYLATVDDIRSSGFMASYSSAISNSGYTLKYFISSKHFSV